MKIELKTADIPWVISENKTADGDMIIVVSSGTRTIWQGYANSKENMDIAQTMVNAVNSRDALVQCLEWSLAQEQYKLENGIKNLDVRKAVLSAIDRMKAALRLAKGK